MARPSADSELAHLSAQLPRAGRVDWIGLRPARDVAMRETDSVQAEGGRGLAGGLAGRGRGRRTAGEGEQSDGGGGEGGLDEHGWPFDDGRNWG